MKAKLLLKVDNSKAWILISNIIFSSTSLTKMQTRLNKDMKKRKREENTFSNLPSQESFTSVKKMKQDHSDLTLSRYNFCSPVLYIHNILLYLFRNLPPY